MFLIKLGGSVITDKAKEETFREATVLRLAAELAKARQPCVIIHGAGSFGHILAKRYRLKEGLTTPEQLIGFASTHASVQRLNSLVLSCLHRHGLAAVSLPPHAIARLSGERLDHLETDVFRQYLTRGLLPVSFGDVALDVARGGGICSGDLLMEALSEALRPTKAIFVLDEDGLYSANPKTTPNARFIETVSAADLPSLSLSLDSRADVTRGMQGKLETVLRIATNGIDVALINGNIENRLYDTLQGRPTKGTIVHGVRSS